MKSIFGLVLAGGKSRRFGRDKALAELCGRPLVAHAIGSLSGHAETVVLSGKSYLGMPFIADRPNSNLGPLGGINAGLNHAAGLGYSHVLTIACDTPFVPPAALDMLVAQDGACVIADHPVIGLWPTALAALLDGFLDKTDRRSIKAWMRRCGAGEVAFEGIVNVNQPDDLEACLRGPAA